MELRDDEHHASPGPFGDLREDEIDDVPGASEDEYDGIPGPFDHLSSGD